MQNDFAGFHVVGFRELVPHRRIYCIGVFVSFLQLFAEIVVSGVVQVRRRLPDAEDRLQRRAAAGQSLDVPSVASVFISRWDKAADPLLPVSLHVQLGLAVANKVYASYRALLEDDRWKALATAGARPQRVLWASTSTKDPTFPDTYYLGRLAAPDTIDTVPEKTLLAFADHGEIELMAPDYAGADACLAEVAAHGIDVDALGESLQRQGAHRFEADWAALLEAIGTKVDALAPA